MRRFANQTAGLVLALAAALAFGPVATAAEAVEKPGNGPAYEKVGLVAVMHRGRIKPVDTVAREEVKQVYGRETMVLRDPREEVAKVLDPEGHHKTTWKVQNGRRSPPSWTGRSGPSSGTINLHPRRLPPAPSGRPGRHDRQPAQGHRRQVDDPRGREGNRFVTWRSNPSSPRRLSPPTSAAAAPDADRETIAELAAEAHRGAQVAHAPRAREATVAADGQTRCRSCRGPRIASDKQDSFDAEPEVRRAAQPRPSVAASRSAVA